MKIKNEKLQLTITVEIACTDSDSFSNQAEFRDTDVFAMKKYLRESIIDSLRGKWQYSAEIERITMQPVKLLNKTA